MDALDKSQIVELDTLAQHEREVRKLWTSCIVGGACVLLALGGSVLLAVAAFGRPVSAVGPAVGVLMNVVALAFGIAFVIPAAVTSLKRLSLTIQMGHRSLVLARQMTETTTKLERRASEVLGKVETAVDKALPVIDVANRLAQDGFLEKIERHLASIKGAVDRQTAPIAPAKRQTT